MLNGDDNDYAMYVVVDHDLNENNDPDFRTFYWHLSDNSNLGDPNDPEDDQDWEQGDPVVAGQIIGRAGNTGFVDPCPVNDADNANGTHLHFEVRTDPIDVDPDDPDPYSGPSKIILLVGGALRVLIQKGIQRSMAWKSSDLIDNQDASFEKFSTGWRQDHDTGAYKGDAWLSRTSGAWAVWH